MDGKEEKTLKVVVPEGYEIDMQNSTLECIRFRKKWNGPKFKKGDVVVDDSVGEGYYARIVDIDSDKIPPAYLVNNPYMASWKPYYVDCSYFDERYKEVTTPIFKSGDFIMGNNVNDIWKYVEVIGVKSVDRFSNYSYILRRPDGEVDFFSCDVIDEVYNKITKKQYKEFLKKKDGDLAKFDIGDVEEEHKFKPGNTVRSKEDGSLYIILSIEKDSLCDCYKYTPIYQVGRSVIYQSCHWVDADFERVNDFCEDKDENYNRYYYLKKLQLLQSHLAHHNIATHVKVETGSELTSFSFADDNCFHTIYFGWYNSVKCEANFDHLLEEISKKYNFSIEDLKEWSER